MKKPEIEGAEIVSDLLEGGAIACITSKPHTIGSASHCPAIPQRLTPSIGKGDWNLNHTLRKSIRVEDDIPV